MTPASLLAWLAVLATGLLTAAIARPVLRRLPEPEVDDAPGYASLPDNRFVLGCGVCSAAAAAVAWATLPAALQPLWTVLAVGGVLLAAIDLATTWLPLRLVQASWLAMAIAALAGASLAGSWSMLLRAAVGAAMAGGLYLAVWLVSRGGFGFGDVRFAPLLGAAAAAASWRLLVATLVVGTLVGGVAGAARMVRRRDGPFPYAPSMLVGAYLAALSGWPG
nr:prepilin peptidase [uncultured Friedmanniella sp.]